ncbi:MAG: hypothetical protein KDB63_01515 [Nocardioidaceae bacterium]|nr:hypothetical protein [Nocardioidaceae bacterium]
MLGTGARTADRLVDGAVLLLATWTPVYHLCLVLALPVPVALALEVGVLGLLVAGSLVAGSLVAGLLGTGSLVAGSLGAGSPRRRRTTPADDGDPADVVTGAPPRADPGPVRRPPTRLLVTGTAAAAAVAALGMAVSAPWPLVWVPWLVAAVLGTWPALRRLAPADRWGGDDRGPTPSAKARRAEPWLVWGWVVVLTAMSVSIRRSNPDDLFYLNVSQWVATHGDFPTRDTLFSDLVYPMANWPPTASYDALVGTVARLLHLPAATVAYQLVLPLATALSVLALWRLLRTWRTPYVAVALSAAVVFLLMDGTVSYGTPGNLWLTRLWQGKVILLCVVVPVLLATAARYAARPSRRGLAWLAAGGSAAVGLTTTSLFVVPVIAVAGMLPLVRTAPRKAAAGFVALAGYPIAGALVTLATGGRSADDFGERRLYRFDAEWIGHLVMLTGVVAVVGVLAVLLGALLVPHAQARVTTGALAVAFGLVLVPGVTELGFRAVGLGPTLWRLSFGLTIGALVGVAAARLWQALLTHSSPRRATVAGAVVATLLVGFGHPIWSRATSSSWQPPLHWQRSDASRDAAEAAVLEAGPGGLVLAPDDLAITIVISQTEVRTVAPRDYYMAYLRNDPSFHYDDRLTLVRMVNGSGPWTEPTADSALRLLDVDVACVSTLNQTAFFVLQRSGYREFYRSDHYQCLSRD